MAHKTIIVAVHDAFFLAKITDAAQALHYQLFPAHSEREIVDIAQQHKPSFIIIDLVNKQLNPLACVEKLKKDPALKEIKIIGYLPHVQIALHEAALKVGCDLVLPRSAFVNVLPKLLQS